MLVPVELQLNIFSKVLTFDRTVEEKPGSELVVGILYQPRVRGSYVAKDQMVQSISATEPTVHGKSLRAVPLVAASASELAAAIQSQGIDVLYVTPLRAVSVAEFAVVTRQQSVLTLTGIPQFVEAGVSVGVGLNGDRPKILINAEAARLEGARLQARLLKLAEIVGS